MSAHLALRSGNPALSANTFTAIPHVVGQEVMTIGGTVNKTAMALAILFITATYVWGQGTAGTLPMGLVWGGFIGGFIVAIVTVFKHAWAPYTTPLYAAFEGAALGGISFIFEQQYPGIVSQAIFLTFGTLGALLVAYRSGIIKATENFKLGVAAATGGIFLVYLLSFIVGFFGVEVPLIHSSGTFGILFSLFVVVIAALNLVLDF
ncbi:MAG: Bax inhibitor-1/YccA family protein, partial [Acidobacteria bacterium]|nr:Bax inhibitor-1/YccA family protein [Acidobacteriota bacterium]